MKARIPPKIPKQLKSLNRKLNGLQKAHMNRSEKKKTKTSRAEYLKQCCMPCIKISALAVTDVQRH